MRLVLSALILLSFAFSVKAQEQTWTWPKAQPEDVGLDAKPLNKGHIKILNGIYGHLDSFLVIKDGVLVYEKYYNGARASEPHLIASVHKSIVSAQIGIAIDQGLIENEEAFIFDYFDQVYENFDNLDENKKNLRIRDFLTMTTGVACGMNRACGVKMRAQDNPLKWFLDLPVTDPPGTVSNYLDGSPYVLEGLISLVSKSNYGEFAQKNLYDPLGIKTRYQDHEDLKLTSREMARFGQLYLNEGVWRGRQIISREWVTRSTAPHWIVEPESPRGYGYLWWTHAYADEKGEPAPFYFASGNGSQFIVVLPALSLVVVITGSNFGVMDGPSPFLLIRDHVLPAALPGR